MRLIDNPNCNPKCRACHYKGLAYPEQIFRKQAWAEQQFVEWVGVLRPMQGAPPDERLGYRAKSWLRTQVVDGRLSFGMLRAVQISGKWEEEFVSWDRCPLHVPGMSETLGRLASALQRHAPDFVSDALMGVWVGAPHLVLVSRIPQFEFPRALAWSEVVADPFHQVWFHHNPQVGRRVLSHHPIVALHGEISHGQEAAHPIRAFRQVAKTLLSQARRLAVHALMADSPAQVLDLYCGTGELSLLLPPTMDWLGVELSSDAVAYANTLSKKRQADHRAFVGSVEHRLADPQLLAALRESFALFINPPRPGVLPAAKEQLSALFARRKPRTIVYLSCSASSLARDLRFFAEMGFAVESLQPFDFFPQTEHFETLAILKLQA